LIPPRPPHRRFTLFPFFFDGAVGSAAPAAATFYTFSVLQRLFRKRSKKFSRRVAAPRPNASSKEVAADRVPVHSGSIRFNPVQSGSIRFNPVQFGSIRFNPVQSGSFRFNPVRSDSIRFVPVRSGSIRFVPLQSGSFRLIPLRSGSIRFNSVRSDLFRFG